MQVEVKRVLEMAKQKKRNERVVRLVDAAARGSLDEVGPPFLMDKTYQSALRAFLWIDHLCDVHQTRR